MSSNLPSYNSTAYVGINATSPGQNWFRNRDPLPSDYKLYAIGDRWINRTAKTIWCLLGRTAGAGEWTPLGGNSIAVSTLLADDLNIVYPTSGNIVVSGDSASGVSTSMPVASELKITVADSTETQKGVVALATNAEAIAGTDIAKAITAEDMQAKLGTTPANSLLIGQGASNSLASLSVGSARQIIQSGGAGVNPGWSTAVYPSTTTDTQVLLSNGANNVVSSGNITSTSAGIVSTPSQSSISYYVSADQANATGDLTDFLVPFNTKDYDNQNEFNTGTSLFTATVAGTYHLDAIVLLYNIAVGHNVGNVKVYQNANIWYQSQYNPGASMDVANQYSAAASTCLKLAVGDTVKIVVQVGGSTKTVGVRAAAGAHTQLQISKIA
jgi:hypothetical protein